MSGALPTRPAALRSLVGFSPARVAEHFGGMNTACGQFRALARASAMLDAARECFVDAYLGG